MSLELVRPFFKSKLEALSFREWETGFDRNDVPETMLHKAFFIGMPSVDFGPVNQTLQSAEFRVELKLYFKGYRSEAQALDEAIASVEDAILSICKASSRGATLKNVVANNADFEPLSEGNGRAVIATIVFTARTCLGLED